MEKQEEEDAQTRTYRDNLREKQTCIKVQTESERTRCARCAAGDKSHRHTDTINGPLITSIVIKNVQYCGLQFMSMSIKKFYLLLND